MSVINIPGQQIAQAPPRPQRIFNPSASNGGTSPTVAFYSPSNSDSFAQLSSKATYNIVA